MKDYDELVNSPSSMIYISLVPFPLDLYKFYWNRSVLTQTSLYFNIQIASLWHLSSSSLPYYFFFVCLFFIRLNLRYDMFTQNTFFFIPMRYFYIVFSYVKAC